MKEWQSGQVFVASVVFLIAGNVIMNFGGAFLFIGGVISFIFGAIIDMYLFGYTQKVIRIIFTKP